MNKINVKEAGGLALLKTKGAVSAVQKSLYDSIQSAPPELRRKAVKVLLAAGIVFVFISGYKYAMFKREELRRAAELAAGPRVRTSTVKKGLGEHSVTLTGETRPYLTAVLYAKVSGYLRAVKVDKGDIVKEGQVLAVIESPETDEAFVAAQADSKNKSAIAERMHALYNKQLVSQQEYEQAQADADVAAARLRSQKTLKDYEVLRAPFPGTVTARYADPGALVQNATSSGSGALPVVTVSQIRRLKVDVFLDQRDAPFISPSDPVQITLAERPDFKLSGTISRLADELDPRTKMLLTEIDIPNEDRKVVAGSFVQVSLKVKAPAYLEAPVEAFVAKGNKNLLTTIKPDNTLAYQEIQIADNDGKTLRILSGANDGELLALGVGEALQEGAKVRPIIETPPPGAAAPGAPAVPAVAPAAKEGGGK
jgi:RND family efflux transporter MFP subunit